MQRVALLMLLGCLVGCRPTPPASSSTTAAAPRAATTTAAARETRSPLGPAFEVLAPGFVQRGRRYSLFLSSGDITWATPDGGLRMKLAGADPAAAPVGEQPLPGHANYLIAGGGAARTNLLRYGAVRYRSILPGIDLLFHVGESAAPEFDFVLAAGADPSRIALQFEGAPPTVLA